MIWGAQAGARSYGLHRIAHVRAAQTSAVERLLSIEHATFKGFSIATHNSCPWFPLPGNPSWENSLMMTERIGATDQLLMSS